MTLVYGTRYFRQHQLRQFFGMGENSRVVYVLSSFHIEREAHQAPIFFKFDSVRQRVFRSTRNALLVGHDELRITLDAIRRIEGEQLLNARVISDTEFVDPWSLQPKEDNDEPKVVVAYGSASSNYVTRYALSRNVFRDNPHTYDLRGRPNETYLQKNGTSGETDRLADDETKDYCILVRWRIGATIYFIISGLGKPGSDIMAAYLFSDWREIYRASRGRDFYFVYEINIQSHELRSLRPAGLRPGHREQLVFGSRLQRLVRRFRKQAAP